MKLGSRYVGYSFADQNLAGAELSGEFVDADFSRANLVGARLSGKFVDTSFTDANLTNADLRDGQFIDTGAIELGQADQPGGLVSWVCSLFR